MNAMKKLFLLGFLALSCLFVNAQDGLQGTWFAGGNVNFGSTKIHTTTGEEKTDRYGVMPLVGTFISPNVAVGAALGFDHLKEGEAKQNLFTIMPLARKYWNITGNFYFFGQASLPVAFGNEKEGDYKANVFGAHVELSPGFDWIVNSWFTVETSFTLVSAGYTSYKPKGGKTDSSWGINGNTIGTKKFGDLTVGVKFLF